ncbi:MAG: basic rane protein [Gaiellales bacterium]|nr:basic rane protein [Gaiellales bacterium]
MARFAGGLFVHSDSSREGRGVRMKMRRGLVVVAALVGAFVAATGANADSTSHTKGSKVTTVAIATPAKPSDYGWNAQGVAGAAAAAKSVGAKLTTVTNVGYDNTESVLRQLAGKKPGLLISHASGYDTIAVRIAQQTGVPTITYDVTKNLVKGKVGVITTSANQGGYLAGILAAKMTKSGTVGIVISASDSNWYLMSGGFAAGVRSVSKSTKIVFATIGPAAYDDAAGGKRVATSVIDQGADVVFGMGDGASLGYIQAVETAKKKTWYIGDIGNIAPIDKKKIQLSSVLWSFTGAYKQAIKDIDAGTFGVKAYDLNLKNGGVSLLKTSYIPAATWALVARAQKGIVAGTVKVPSTTTKGAVDKLVKS